MAKTVKLCLATKVVKDLTAKIEAIKEKREPMPRRMNSCAENEKPVFRRSYPLAAAIVGMANKKENSTASTRFRPENRPPTIEAAERETPGTMERD